MLQKLPPLGWLRAFESSARHLSFTRAAAELNLTQAAVSKQVKLLEQFLSEPLFHRKPRSLVLTRVGAAYLPKVRDAFERLVDGTEEVFGPSEGQVLTLRAPVSYAVNWLAPRLSDFFEQHPDVDLRIVSSVWDEELDRERFDLDIRYGLGLWPGHRCQQVTFETLEPVCAPHMIARLQSPQDLMDHKLLHVLGYEDGWGIWFRHMGLDELSAGSGMHFDTSVMAFQVAALGGGVALGRASMLEWELQSGRLVRPFESAVPVAEAFHLLTPEDRKTHPKAGVFAEWLQNAVASDPLMQRNKTLCETLKAR